jgi:hypothetical protein
MMDKKMSVPEDHKHCDWCKKAVHKSAFEMNPETNKLYSHCTRCRQSHTECQKKFDATKAGAATRKRWAESSRGKECIKKHNSYRVVRRRTDEALKLDHSLMSIARHLVKGVNKTSPKFISISGFGSEMVFIDCIKAAAARSGFDLDTYGETWQLEHKIPREAYDFNNPEDVRRCWSPKNVHALSPADNKAKSWKLLDHYLMEAGAENFPVAWNGQLPDEEFKKAFYAKCLAESTPSTTGASSSGATI